MANESNAKQVSGTTFDTADVVVALFALITGIFALSSGFVVLRKFMASGSEWDALLAALQFAGAAILLMLSHDHMVKSTPK